MNLDFSKNRVLIIGDIMLDRYMYGEIFRMSPEADIPVLEEIRIENRLGGAANVALNIHALGASAMLCGVLGLDENAKVFKKEMEDRGLDSTHVVIDRERMTTVKTRVISDNKHIVRVDMEDTKDVSQLISDTIYDKVQSLLEGTEIDMIIFQDYNKGVLTSYNIPRLIALANNYAIPTAVDPKKKNFLLYKDVTIFKPNRREIEDQFGKIASINSMHLNEITEKLQTEIHAKYVFITLSENGIYFSHNELSGIVEVRAGEIIDVSGAGDSVMSMICLALLNKFSLAQIANLSNEVGLQVCGHSGVVPIDLERLKSQIGHL